MKTKPDRKTGIEQVLQQARKIDNLHTIWGRMFKRAGFKMRAHKENGHIRVWRVA